MNMSTLRASGLAEDRFGAAVASRLSEAAEALPHDISERLRAARAQAVGRRKVVHQPVGVLARGGGTATLTLGDDGPGLWQRMAAFVPLVALVAGLLLIDSVQNDIRASEVAEVDAALLTDDLPPAAYTDPGFLQFVKSAREASTR